MLPFHVARSVIEQALMLLVQSEAGESSSWFERFREAVRGSLGPPLRDIHRPIDAWLGSLPMWVAMVCALGLYLAALIWVWCLPREFVFRGVPDAKRWRDLRFWATVVILPYIVVYLWLGR